MEIITVHLDGVPYPTEMVNGVQRFVRNPIIDLFVDASTAVWDKLGHRKADEVGVYTLNNLSIDYQLGRHGITKQHMLEFYMGMGYSVSGMMDLSHFEDIEVKNPLWGDE